MNEDLFSLNSELFDSLSISETIEVRKKYFAFHKEAIRRAKPSECFLCGKKCSSFCNSHTIPQFILKGISANGLYIDINRFLKTPITNELIGIKDVDIFCLICMDCDGKYFKNYENPNNYSNEKPTQEMLAEIALKTNLRMQWKRKIETEMNSLIMSLFQSTTLPYDDMFEKDISKSNVMDLNEFKHNSEFAVRAINGKNKGYFLIDYLTLEYTTKLAFQGVVALITGFDNELINNIFYMYPDYRLQYLHICVLPVNGKTHIFLFIQDGDKRYSKFYKHYLKLSLDEKLCILNYILTLYSEEWVLTSSLDKDLFNDENLKKVLKTTQRPLPGSKADFENEQQYKDFVLKSAIETFSLKTIPDIPNFFTPVEE